MTPREIIAEAWSMTQRERKIRAWGFASELLETLLDTKLLIYQTYFAYTYMQGDPIGFFAVEEYLMQALPLWGFITFITILILLVILEIFIPKMCLGAIIGLAAKSHKKEEVKGGLVLALYNFLPLFAVREFFVLGHITIVITISSLVLRYMPSGLHIPIIALALIFWFLSNIFRLLSIFAEEDIVIRKSGIFAAIGRSFKLIISHISHVLFLFLLLLVISLRILLNAVVLFVLPAVIIGLSVLFAYFLSTALTIIFTTIAAIIIILFASYFFAYVHVFTQTVWTITYMELQKMKDLDIIDIGEEEPPAVMPEETTPPEEALAAPAAPEVA
ncbi:MAG TPA: hypothetical protein VJB82_02595 [Candidatus Peribacterales bacterium]|nr:hypothetical protein [Candidatus Peribacterales bacterium]